MPGVHLPSMKMPKVDFKGPQVDIKGPKIDLKGAKGEVTVPREKRGHVQGPHAKVQMPSMKMPKVDFKGPQVDIKGPKLDLMGAKGEVTVPDMEVSLPSVDVDIQASGAKLEGDIVVGDTEVATKDSKFKMPKFKMPSFGTSGTGKSIGASVDVSLPSIQTDIKTSDLSIDLPSADVDIKTGELGVSSQRVTCLRESSRTLLWSWTQRAPAWDSPAQHEDAQSRLQEPPGGHQGAQTRPEGRQRGVTSPTWRFRCLIWTLSLRRQAGGDIVVGDTEVATKTASSRCPSSRCLPSVLWQASPLGSVDVTLQRLRQTALPSIQTDIKTSDLSIDLPSADVDIKTGELRVKLPEGRARGTSSGVGLKAMPGRLQGPQVDIKGPNDLKAPRGGDRPRGRSELGEGRAKQKGHVQGHMPKVQMPSMKMPK
ncbi:LOW QUALITY PROTEIN: hypothetical protein QTO34_020216 [Cnephaeus nilssonii]|uniref:Uncharacterized protein n=1 Tax=Cnephaeus nilssonii TaxID=3371016 RepID=A0AA40HY92_CNENI|nr:LOW QUALITY PROTEIN: hypothetical protein QTO34_020216 [Eptesicus nilssonii]